MTTSITCPQSRRSLVLVLVTTGLFSGCGSSPPVESPRARAPGHGLETLDPPTDSDELASISPRRDEPEGELTLREALSLSLVNSPELAAFSWSVRASEARALQAGLLPNPELEGNVEEFGGSSEFSGFDNSESTIALSQLVELGGKRSKRLRVAELGSTLAAWDYESKRISVLARTSQAFVGVLASQMRLELAQRSLELAEQVFTSARERVRAGKSSPLEETRASVLVSRNLISLERARRSLNAARVRLASTWGSTTPRFTAVTGELEAVPPVPSYDEVADLVSENPDIARWAVELTAREARVELEKAQSVPDVRVRGGVRLLGGTDDTAFVVGLSLPLPIFDRNQGKVREAQFNLARAGEERRAAEVRVRTQFASAYEQLLLSHAEVTTFRDDVLPGAAEAFESTRVAFAEGKLGYLDVLDAERTLFDVRGEYVEALASYHGAKAVVEALLGRPLDAITDKSAEGTDR